MPSRGGYNQKEKESKMSKTQRLKIQMINIAVVRLIKFVVDMDRNANSLVVDFAHIRGVVVPWTTDTTLFFSPDLYV